jgi:hypothetical protein
MDDLKNKITNIIAILVALGTVIATALDRVPEGAKWYIWVGAVVIAVIAWFVGKNPDGTAKKKPVIQ